MLLVNPEHHHFGGGRGTVSRNNDDYGDLLVSARLSVCSQQSESQTSARPHLCHQPPCRATVGRGLVWCTTQVSELKTIYTVVETEKVIIGLGVYFHFLSDISQHLITSSTHAFVYYVCRCHVLFCLFDCNIYVSHVSLIKLLVS